MSKYTIQFLCILGMILAVLIYGEIQRSNAINEIKQEYATKAKLDSLGKRHKLAIDILNTQIQQYDTARQKRIDSLHHLVPELP